MKTYSFQIDFNEDNFVNTVRECVDSESKGIEELRHDPSFTVSLVEHGLEQLRFDNDLFPPCTFDFELENRERAIELAKKINKTSAHSYVDWIFENDEDDNLTGSISSERFDTEDWDNE